MDDIIQHLNLFAPLFSLRVWPSAQLLLIGALLTPSERTVASVLRTMGRSGEADCTTYHRVLNRAVWSARCGSRILLGVLVKTFVPEDATVVLGGDDTLERRGGRRIRGRGCYRDGVRSTGRHTVRCFGLKWVSLMVLVGLPWSGRVWALPFLTVLCPASTAAGRRPKTSVDWMRQMVVQTRRWLPGRRLVLVVDGAYAALSLAWGAKSRRWAWCRGCGGMRACFIRRPPGNPASAARHRTKERGNAPCARGRPGAIPRGSPRR